MLAAGGFLHSAGCFERPADVLVRSSTEFDATGQPGEAMKRPAEVEVGAMNAGGEVIRVGAKIHAQ
jgi:hypothetical protein